MKCCIPGTTNEWYYEVPYSAGVNYEIVAEDMYGNVATTSALPVTCSP